MGDSTVEISAIVPVSERHDDVRELYNEYKKALEETGRSYEIIYVLDGPFSDTLSALEKLRAEGESVRVIQLAKSFGEATALSVAFQHSTGNIILTLPAYYQVRPSEIPKLLEGFGDADMAIARRWPRCDSRLKQAQTLVFHGLLRFFGDCSFHDLGCGMRAFDRKIIEEIPIYGDQHRFLPVLAEKWGYKVEEVNVTQSNRDHAPRFYRFGIYLRRVLDILTVFFLVKFTKKPLRFFGLIGSSLIALGGLSLLYVIVERIFFAVSLADRPALLLSSLFVVLGIQLFALGLIGELIIFTHAREIKEYTIDKILN